MDVKIDLFKLEAEAATLADTLAAEAARVATNSHLTAEGKADAWQAAADRYAGDVEELRAYARLAAAAAERMVDYARSAAVGPAPEPGKPDAALELALARLLARRDTWSTEDVQATLEPILGTALAAVFVAELVARGKVTRDSMDALLEHMAADVSAAREEQPLVQTAVNACFAPRVAEIEALMENGPMSPGAASPGGVTRRPHSPLSDLAVTRLVLWSSGRVETDLEVSPYV